MKYKIKVEVKNDGSCKYYPMIKKHWWSRWRLLCIASKKWECHEYFTDLEAARRVIRNFDSHQLNHIYDIPYKEEE